MEKPKRAPKKMDPKVKRKWLKALRSGKYRQGAGVLRAHSPAAKVTDRYCCLGVLCDLVAPERWGSLEPRPFGQSCEVQHGLTAVMPSRTLLQEVGLTLSVARTLAAKNDDGNSFKKIADFIEENL